MATVEHVLHAYILVKPQKALEGSLWICLAISEIHFFTVKVKIELLTN